MYDHLIFNCLDSIFRRAVEIAFLSTSDFQEILLKKKFNLIKTKSHRFNYARWLECMNAETPPFPIDCMWWWPLSCVNIRVIEESLSLGIASLLRYRYHLRCRLPYYYFRLLQELPSTRETRSHNRASALRLPSNSSHLRRAVSVKTWLRVLRHSLW